MFENVRGLLYSNKWYFELILSEFKKLGYLIEYKLLNAVHFGVPQNRERLFVIGHRSKFVFPRHESKKVTVGEAIGDTMFTIPENSRFLTPSMDAYVARYEKASDCINPRDLYSDKPARTLTCRNLAGATGDRGDRGVYPKSIDLIVLPDLEKPGEWKVRYKEKLAIAQKETERYEVIRERIVKASKLARRNHYSIELMARINEFQVYPSKLLLLLEKYDTAASDSDKKAAGEEIYHYVESFSKIRSDLEQVISEKRFLKNPEGYIRAKTADLANGGIDNKWMFVHETPMNEKILTWLKPLLNK